MYRLIIGFIIVFLFYNQFAFSQSNDVFVDIHADNSFFSPNQHNKTRGQNEESVFYEGFDGSTFPPAGWTDSVVNTQNTWRQFLIERAPFSIIDPDDSYSAVVPYSYYFQNEWLISPEIDITDLKTLSLEFYAGYSENWLDSANLSLFVSNNHGNTWDSLWSAQDTSGYYVWKWRRINIDLYDYANDTLNADSLKFAWRYKGEAGDLMAIDGINLSGGGLSQEADILSFSLETQKSSAKFTNDTIRIEILSNPDLTYISPHLTISKGASVVPGADETLSYTYTPDSAVYEYVVTAADHTITKKYTLLVRMTEPGKEAEFISFSLPQQTNEADIDTTKNKILIEVEYGTDLSNLIPDFSLSTGAKSEPENGEAFDVSDGEPFIIKVFPQDPALDPQEYKLIVTVRDYMNNILSFKVDNEISHAYIDTAMHTVFDTLAYEADFKTLIPEFTVSLGATVSPVSGQMLSFTPGEAEIFTLTAANGDIQKWKVYLIRDIKTVYAEYFDDSDAFEINNWQINIIDSTKTWSVSKQDWQPFSNINPISKFSALCPWSRNEQDEWLVSDTLQINDVENLYMQFYAGFNKNYLDSANLFLHIINCETKDTSLIWNAKEINAPDSIAWNWYKIELDLNAYIGTKIRLAWQYKGKNGDTAGIDGFMLFDKTNTLNIESMKKMTGLITIFPNPANECIEIQNIKKCEYIIFNIKGKKYFDGNYSGKSKINISHFPKGIYILKIQDERNSKSIKFIKQ